MYPWTKQRRRSRAAYWLAAFAALAILAVLIAGGRPSPVAPSPPAAGARPTERTAVVAALAYLDALRWDVVIDDQRRLATISEYAIEDVAAQLDAELAAPADALRAAVSEGPVVARRAVLGYRLDRFSREEASVSVWGVALFATGVYEPTTQWSTSEIDLVWQAGRWRVSGVRSEGGPSPDSRLAVLAQETRDFRELSDAP